MSGADEAGAGQGPAVAVIGMAGRFPGARDVEEFWNNLRDGVHSISFFSDEELEAAGVDPELSRRPDYVRAGGVMEGVDRFDAAFFGFNPREAEVIDPQHRVFLETAWEALENAGYAGDTTAQSIGIYAGSGTSHYLTYNVLSNPEVMEAVGAFQVHIGNGKDFLATRASYKLNLRGPALNVQTGCSTGLVAVHVATQALLNGECDVAVAGGVSLNMMQGHGYLYSPGGVLSPDGHCRSFDAEAGGAISGSGAALVVLKRLDDALADGDTVHAVVRGSAINNDGAGKVGFTAPSVDGQAAVIEEALAVGDVDPATVTMVEAHGTATDLGDPIEVTALTQAFGDTPRKQYCALGSVKSNVGHLDTAAGTTGMIKVIQSLEHRQIPPTLHYRKPNPNIDFERSPFFVNTELREWRTEGFPRRAGVSSFGIGGTNAHVVLEEAPEREPSEAARGWHLLTLSARTPTALEAATDRLAAHLRAHPEQEVADVAFTLQAGRRAFEHRRVLVCRGREEAAAALEARAPQRVVSGVAGEGARPVAFLFPGVGDHYPQMGRGLYETEPLFRAEVDRCAEILRPFLGADLREVLFPGEAPAEEAPGGIDLRRMLSRDAQGPDEAAERLNRTLFAQTGLFVTEYALAKQWLAWGVKPEAMIGHSLGEYVAATVAGVFSLEDALALVAERSRMIEELPEGAMLSVPLPADEVRPLLGDGLSLGTVNGPAMTTVSGTPGAVAALERSLTARGVACRRLPTTHAFHSAMMEPVAARLTERMRRVRLAAPKIPFVSNVTGTWIRASEATDPAYWTRHLCQTVRFAEGVEALLADGSRRVLLELGPGQTLGTFVRQRPVPEGGAEPAVVASMRHGYERHSDAAFLLGAAGRLWLAGAAVDWKAMHAHERLRRVPLPTYPFESRRYWLDARRGPAPAETRGDPLAKKADPADWLYLPAWKRAPLPAPAEGEPAAWLVLADAAGTGARLAARLEQGGHTVTLVETGEGFARLGERRFTARPGSDGCFRALREALGAAGAGPRRVVHLWGLGAEGESPEEAIARGYSSLLLLALHFGRDRAEGPLRIDVVTSGAQDVAGGEAVRPERAAVLGAAIAIPQELPHVVCRCVDVAPAAAGGGDRLAEQLLAEVASGAADAVVAYRGARRWARSWEAVRPEPGAAGVRQGGVYLFSGGLAGGSDAVAAHLAETARARVAVVVDPAFPEREGWGALAADGSPEDPAAATARAVLVLEAGGKEVLVLRAAPGDAAALAAAVAAVRGRFGALDGVVHTFGLGAAGERVAVAEMRPEATAAELARISRELEALERALEGVPLDWCALWNSLLSVFGGAGLAAAAAASALVDARARRHAAATGARWTSVDWDRWLLAEGEGHGAWDERAMTRREGALAFEKVAALAGEPQVVVSTHDLAARIEHFLSPRLAQAQDATLHVRPELGTAYAAPTHEAEEILVGIWGDLLGIGEIGIHDDVFHLGGHSLLATQLISRVRDTFQVELPLRAIFEAPTVALLAQLIEEMIIMELEQMSDEEAMSLV